jgi:hypothetical protein
MNAHKLREEVFPVEVVRQRLERIATLEGKLAWQIEEAILAWWRGRGGGVRKTSNCADRRPIGNRWVNG